jgi:leader peptidase (prepilin peptidase)/N-methyltransferase
MAYSDIKTLEISDTLNISTWLLGCYVGSAYNGYKETLIATFVVIGVMTMIRFIVTSFLTKEAMGEADIVVVGTIGGLLGIQGALIALFIASLLALCVLVITRRFSQPLPFIPFLVLGTFTQVVTEKYFISLNGITL